MLRKVPLGPDSDDQPADTFVYEVLSSPEKLRPPTKRKRSPRGLACAGYRGGPEKRPARSEFPKRGCAARRADPGDVTQDHPDAIELSGSGCRYILLSCG